MYMQSSRAALALMVLFTVFRVGTICASDNNLNGLPISDVLFVSALDESQVSVEVSGVTNGVELRFTTPEISALARNNNHSWRIRNEGITAMPGYPDLPAISRWIKVPDHGKIQVNYVIEEQKRITGTPPGIFQANIEEDQNDVSAVELDGIWPTHPVKMSQPMVMRGVRVVALSYYPVQWDPVRGEYVHNRSIDVTIQATNGVGINEVGQLQRSPSRGFDVMLDHLCVNPPQRDMSDEEYNPGGYLVVADENAPESIQEFISWKRRSGHPVELLAFQENTPAEDLRGMIQERYEETGFEFLVLMGSDAAAPPLRFPVPDEDEFYDIYFAQIEGDDILPDVAVGTFNCLTDDNLTCAIRRAISYQSTPFYENTDWFTRAGVGVGACSVPNDLSPSYTGKWVTEVLERYGFDDISTSYYADNGVDDPSAMVEWLYNEQTNFILIRAHEWDLEVDNIGDERVYPFHFLVSSGTISPPESGAFNWAFRMGNPQDMRGPSAGFGHYSSPRTNCANALAGGLIESMFLFDIGSYGWARNYTVANLNRVMVEDGFELMPYYYSHWRYYGDPGQWCWVGVPLELEVEFPESIDPDAVFTRIIVHDSQDQPVPNALVCLAQDDGLQLTALTDQEGNACFHWNEGVLGEGDVHVTVTGKNLLPFMDEIRTTDADWVVVPENIEFDDQEGGDGDGVLNAGEQATLSMDLVHMGAEPLVPELLEVSIVSLSSWVEVAGELNWEDGIQPGESIPIDGEFNVTMLDGCPDEEEILFRIILEWDETFLETGFRDRVVAPDLALVQVEGDIEPGERSDLTVTISNTGGKDCDALQARLEPAVPYVIILREEGSFPGIPAGDEAVQVGDPFRVEARASTVPGMMAGFRLILEGDPGVLDTVMVTLPVGAAGANDPLGPDGYGYIALADTDDDIEFVDAPEYEWIEICPWMENPDFQGESLPINMGGEDDVTVLVDLPFPFAYYGREYNEVSVCSNGWIAAGDQTNLKNQQNWVMPGFDGAFGMLAVFWDRLHYEMRSDGLLGYYDAQGGRYILEWLTGVEDWGDRSNNIFQAIIYDPQQHPTVTGNSNVLFQYHTVSNVQDQNEANAHATVGISSPDGLDGLTYTYWNEYPVQCPEIEARRAILWTTVAYSPLASLSGQVVRWIDSTGVGGVIVTTSHGYEAVTDQEGFFRIVGVEPGVVDVTAARELFAPLTIQDVELIGGEETELDFVLPHGWMIYDPLEIDLILSDESYYSESTINCASIGELDAHFSYRTTILDSLDGFSMETMEDGPLDVASGSDMDIVFTFDAELCISGSFQARIDFEQTIPNSVQSINVRIDRVSSANDDEMPPTEFDLANPYPNPFNSEITIRFDLPKQSPVKLSLYDLQGREVARILDKVLKSGNHRTVFNAVDLPNGLYFVRMETGSFTSVQRVILLR